MSDKKNHIRKKQSFRNFRVTLGHAGNTYSEAGSVDKQWFLIFHYLVFMMQLSFSLLAFLFTLYVAINVERTHVV